ncbi:MAG: hypothetical protein COX70_02335 [Flavobacteriales bacterium CG_4_10_14_0_2_um_filter_32_8]|nr:MAG: hypothetical protein COX70_02335 [Flavobacteriales bacterium CG_4_10_14_0_2_um_filter_32_8]PJB14999.1 MAG: hypothetical protein CO118_05595 [Flavobacteriales bacterium CG_4_9_14_3_um_filter_32_8]
MKMGKILVIEDEKNIRETIADILVLNGYDVECVENGKKGLSKAIQIKPDLVLCDVMMPEMDGWETVKAFRLNPELYCTPFIFLSALATMKDFRNGMNLGADDYLSKPFQIDELLQIISSQLTKVEIRKKIQHLDSNKNKKEAISDFKIKVKEKAKGFLDSLERAKMVQNVILPSNDEMKEFFPEHFIFYLPKESISGDFYWVKKIDDITLIAVADCTGHGIPAALISMVCYTMLNTVINQFGYQNPANILTEVNNLVCEFMSAHHKNYIGDGMDISLCAIDDNRKLLKYAGAKRPIYINAKTFKKSAISEDNLRIYENEIGEKLYEIKASNASVGGIGASFNIQEQVFPYQKGDIIYLSSDGYGDQFGGKEDKKYKTKNLKKLLLSFQDLAMNNQKKLIARDFKNWKKNKEQTDDVTIIGVRL